MSLQTLASQGVLWRLLEGSAYRGDFVGMLRVFEYRLCPY